MSSKAEIIRLLEEGYNIRQINREIGVTRESVRYFLKKNPYYKLMLDYNQKKQKWERKNERLRKSKDGNK